MDIPVFDAHCDTISEAKNKNCGLRKNKLHVDIERGRGFSPYAQVFAVFTRPTTGSITEMDYTKDWPSEILTQMADELISLLLSELEKNSDILTLCRSAADVKSAAESGKAAALIAVEGAELLGCDLERLKRAYDKGVRFVNLCWNFDNALCGAANGAAKGGLTDSGAQFVRTMQDLGIAVDLSHASEHTFWDVAEIARRPIIAGHSNSKAVCDNPRNLTDDQFKTIAKLEGVVGLNLCPNFLCESGDAGIEDIIRHAEHFLGLGGEKTVCLGGDLDGIDDLPKEMTGIESYSKLYEAMLRRNYTESLVQDIFYNNLYNVLEKVL